MRKGMRWLMGALISVLFSASVAGTALADEALKAPERADWSNTVETKATWKKVEDATGYQLRLYFHGNHIHTIHSNQTSIDLAEYMTREGVYSYDVRAVAENKSGVKYRESSAYTESQTRIIKELGDTLGRWKNYQEGKKYQKDDGLLVTAQWYRIMGKWYYFDRNGYMAIGWKKLDDAWYYFAEDGAMRTGWQVLGEKTYYLNEEGKMHTGWLQGAPEQWYYFYEDGSMAVNTTIDEYVINEMGLWMS